MRARESQREREKIAAAAKCAENAFHGEGEGEGKPPIRPQLDPLSPSRSRFRPFSSPSHTLLFMGTRYAEAEDAQRAERQMKKDIRVQ